MLDLRILIERIRGSVVTMGSQLEYLFTKLAYGSRVNSIKISLNLYHINSKLLYRYLYLLNQIVLILISLYMSELQYNTHCSLILQFRTNMCFVILFDA